MDPSVDQPTSGGTESEPLFIPPPPIEASPEPHPAPVSAPVAPVWHTAVLLAFIFAVSLRGVVRSPLAHVYGSHYRIAAYAVTGVFQLLLLAWVALGVHLRKTPLRSLFGSASIKIRAVFLDIGIAFAFWAGSMVILSTLAIFWLAIQTVLTHPHLAAHSGPFLQPDPTQQKLVRSLGNLAPSSGTEIVCWILLCLLVGVVEELVFRGYLMRQFSAWGRGAAAIGAVFSSLVFGAAHGYEGARNMFLLTVFGALFALLALFRRSLRAGIFAHSWHDIFVGLVLAFFQSRHLL
jgi:membrane protease YdiL (CAAX protease family)